MTSANVVEYTIFNGEDEVGHYRQHMMCKSHYSELLQYTPLDQHTILAWGYDEEEEYWSDEKPENLKTFLMKMKNSEKELKESPELND